MTRAIPRGYELAEPDQTHAVRMLGSVFHGHAALEAAGAFNPTDIAAQPSSAWTPDGLDTGVRSRSAL